jgi:hypothetical protein
LIAQKQDLGWIVNCKLDRLWKETVVALYELPAFGLRNTKKPKKSHSDGWCYWLKNVLTFHVVWLKSVSFSNRVLKWRITTFAVRMLHTVSNRPVGHCTAYYCRKHIHRNTNKQSPFEQLTVSIKKFAAISTYNPLTCSQESDSVADREADESNLHHHSIFSLNVCSSYNLSICLIRSRIKIFATRILINFVHVLTFYWHIVSIHIDHHELHVEE